eukprot:GHRR01017045.1.p3 GENE.GHRR01017045.1~~GHRR01017045.1.p3  ORF type:complete len:104 (+),score=8.59 GHRR01017045.1:858-1169(+)
MSKYTPIDVHENWPMTAIVQISCRLLFFWATVVDYAVHHLMCHTVTQPLQFIETVHSIRLDRMTHRWPSPPAIAIKHHCVCFRFIACYSIVDGLWGQARLISF